MASYQTFQLGRKSWFQPLRFNSTAPVFSASRILRKAS